MQHLNVGNIFKYFKNPKVGNIFLNYFLIQNLNKVINLANSTQMSTIFVDYLKIPKVGNTFQSLYINKLN